MCGSPRRAKERQKLLQKEEEVGSTEVSINMHGCACICVDHFQSVYWIHYMIASAYVLGFGPWGKAWGILAPQPEIEPALCIRRRSLNHWITREVPAPWHFTGSILARKERESFLFLLGSASITGHESAPTLARLCSSELSIYSFLSGLVFSGCSVSELEKMNRLWRL